MSIANNVEAMDFHRETIASKLPVQAHRALMLMSRPGDDRFRGLPLNQIAACFPTRNTPWIVRVAHDEFVFTTSWCGDAPGNAQGVLKTRLTRLRLRGVMDEEVLSWISELQKVQQRCFVQRVWTLESGLSHLGRIRDGRRIVVGSPEGAQQVYLSVLALVASACRSHLLQHGVNINIIPSLPEGV